ncbi:heparin lyase I family protein [Bradyrhizobium sp. Tv2a-2]|uniref:heparin lyase I family protein n=1 Tax=Bradyrhizobium sp. Tv2a-2 TaxID=113395 RepID=UPI000411A1DF|nr:heparin lyase I family protein [Bradyrhizobium sp. Tv2a-2]
MQAVDTLISTLKSASIWQTFDLFYCFAAPSQNACNFNWVNPLVGLLTPHGSLTYQPYSYVASDGSTGWFSTTFGVNSGKAVDGSAEFGHFCLSEASDGISVFQSTGGRSFTSLVASGTAINNMTGGLNTSTTGTWSSQWGSTVGHWVLQQEDTSSTLEAFLDGASLGTQVKTHSADSGTVQLFKSSGGSFTSRQTALVHYGSKLTGPQQLALSQALYTFLAAVGVKPLAGYLGLTTGPTNPAAYKHIPNTTTTFPVTVSPLALVGEIQGRAGAYPYNLILNNDPNYGRLWRLEVHGGDFASFDHTYIDRVQINTGFGAGLYPWQTTMDQAFSFFIESGGVYSTDFMDLVVDWHDQTSGVNAGPGMTPETNGSGNIFVWGYNATGSPTYINEYPDTTFATKPAQGVWHHVRLTWRWDNAPNGFLKVWFDGAQILNYTGGQFGTAAGAPFWYNLALYRGDRTGSTTTPFAVWVANMEIDSSGTQPLSSRINTPLPTPPLV